MIFWTLQNTKKLLKLRKLENLKNTREGRKDSFSAFFVFYRQLIPRHSGKHYAGLKPLQKEVFSYRLYTLGFSKQSR